MPKFLGEAEIDPVAEKIDEEIAESGEEAVVPQHRFDPLGQYGDLSNGGSVGSARVIPVGESGAVKFGKDEREPGRPTVRAAWMWDGRPTTLPLSYEPSGKRHDGGRRYLQKRHCTVCNYSGFYGQVCPACRKEGRELAPAVPAFYPSLDKVPVRRQFFGVVDCFIPACVRRGKYGFIDDPQMRQHAMSRHRVEYRAFMDAQQSRSDQEMASMRAQIAALMQAQLGSEKPRRKSVRGRKAQDAAGAAA